MNWIDGSVVLVAVAMVWFFGTKLRHGMRDRINLLEKEKKTHEDLIARLTVEYLREKRDNTMLKLTSANAEARDVLSYVLKQQNEMLADAERTAHARGITASSR